MILRDVTGRIIGYSDPKTLANAYSLLARADLALTRASRQRIWSQLYYYYSYVTKGLASIIPEIDYLPPIQDWQLQVPQYWITLSRQRRGRNIAFKVGFENKVSANSAIRDIFPYLRVIFNNDPDMASDLAITYRLFDVEPGKRQTRIIWNKEIDYFAKNPAINKEIKILVRQKYTDLERIKKSEVDEEVLQEAKQLQQTLKETHLKKSTLKSKKKRKRKTSKEIPKGPKEETPSKQVKQITKKAKKNEEKKKPEKKAKRTKIDSKTLTDFFN
jgi:hypothetical protein